MSIEAPAYEGELQAGWKYSCPDCHTQSGMFLTRKSLQAYIEHIFKVHATDEDFILIARILLAEYPPHYCGPANQKKSRKTVKKSIQAVMKSTVTVEDDVEEEGDDAEEDDEEEDEPEPAPKTTRKSGVKATVKPAPKSGVKATTKPAPKSGTKASTEPVCVINMDSDSDDSDYIPKKRA
jgi:hypothetical protein